MSCEIYNAPPIITIWYKLAGFIILSIQNFLSGLINRLIVFLVLVLLTFILPRLVPGDPVDIFLSADEVRDLHPAELTALRDKMGLTGSWLDQLGHYLAKVMTGDLGYSHLHAAPVSELLSTSLPWTGLIIFGAFPIYLLIGVTAGIVAGRLAHHKTDIFLTHLMTLLASVPPFMAAIFLSLLFGILWPILPISGAEPLFVSDDPATRVIDMIQHAILPCVSLAIHEIVRFYFLARGESISLTARPFMINAYARGITGWRAFIHYYGLNIFPILLARMSDSITVLVGAVLFVEIVFSYPGIGHLIYDAILDQDYMLLQGAILGLAAIVLSANWIIDLVVASFAKRG